jgi:secreted trypsin-like serine protease|eukprot:6026882-Prymnesium_polylepis.2
MSHPHPADVSVAPPARNAAENSCSATISVSSMRVHESYDSSTIDNDVAILYLTTSHRPRREPLCRDSRT